MIRVNYHTEDRERAHRGSAFLPSVPRVGERVWIDLDGNNSVTLEVVEVEYVHNLKRNSEGGLDYNKGAFTGFINLTFEHVNVLVKEIKSDWPDFPYELPAREL